MQDNLNKEIIIPIELLAVDRDAMYRTFKDMEKGRVSYSGSRPLDVFGVLEGQHQGKYIIKDGYHRLFQALLTGKKEVHVLVEEVGDYSACLFSVNTLLALDSSLKYGGLENLADEELLEKCFTF